MRNDSKGIDIMPFGNLDECYDSQCLWSSPKVKGKSGSFTRFWTYKAAAKEKLEMTKQPQDGCL